MKDYLELRGYIKNMQILSTDRDFEAITNDNLLHNRLNIRVRPLKSTTLGVELRNRIFTGESVDAVPNYGSLVAQDSGLLDMSLILAETDALVVLSQVDRLWINWSNEKWEVRAGRQRINWGINLFWNSNDVFNAYSLIDFDYEERPGVDAIRVQRHFSKMRSVDIAIKPSEHDDKWIGAGMYRFNKWGYDIQLLGSWWNEDVAVGAGWAGNIKNAGLKGEATYFHPQSNWQDTTGEWSASVSADYVFANQLFLTGGFLFASTGVDSSFTIDQALISTVPSAKRLMPAKYNLLGNLAYPVSPLFQLGLVTTYSPGVNSLFVMPSAGYSIADNWEVALFGQSYWLDTGKFINLGNGVFIRLKGSF